MSITSTNKTEKLNQLISEQEALLSALKHEAKELDDASVLIENERLTAEVASLQSRSSSLEAENEQLKKELTTAKSALFTKMANEKLNAFTSAQKKIDSYYYREASTSASRLDAYERYCRDSIRLTLESIDKYASSEYDDLRTRLYALNSELEQRHNSIEQIRAQQLSQLEAKNAEVGVGLKNEPLLESEKRTALKQKNLESFIGLNILSKAGILLFLIGIVMLGRFAYVHMSDVFKGGIIFVLGAVLIAVGELFNKKEKTVFSNALISGGVSVLYAAAATGYFAFELYSAKVTFLLCIVITFIAIAISQQLQSQVVCAFGAVGGYLPVVASYMISFGKAESDVTFLPVSSVYFCLVAVIVFVMSYNKRWYASQFIGYAMHLVAIGGVASCAWAVRSLPGYSYALPLAAVFSVVSFIIYLMIPASKILTGKALGTGDIVLLTLNTVSGAISVSITIHNCFSSADYANRILGFVFLAFAAIYTILMSVSVRNKKEKNEISLAVTSIAALVFSMLVIPYIFGITYAPIAWAAEGVIIAIISIERKMAVVEGAGITCMLISAICYAVLYNTSYEKYSALSIISFGVVLSAFWIYSVRGLIENRETSYNNPVYIIFELCSAVASFIFLYNLYNCFTEGPLVNSYSRFTDMAVALVFILVIATALRLGILKNDISAVFSDIVGILLVPVCFIGLDLVNSYNEVYNYFGAYVEKSGQEIVNLVLLIALNILIEIFFAIGVADIINRISAPVWIYTASISASALFLITAVLMSQFFVPFSSSIISGVYIAAACVLLVIGFRKQFTVVRFGGLILILAAFAKLCIVDTFKLESGWKIASYFAFGAILILISYVYQRFSKRLEGEAQSIIESGDAAAEQ